MKQTALQRTPTKILIVEDEGDMCLLLNIILKDEQMELDHVKSLSDAASYLQSTQPEVVLLDNKLPDGFGVDFISRIKTQYPATKVIMLSGYDASASDVALNNGADVFLTKPFSKDQLSSAVRGLLASQN